MDCDTVVFFYMRRSAYGNLLLTQHADRTASRGEGHSPTRLIYGLYNWQL